MKMEFIPTTTKGNACYCRPSGSNSHTKKEIISKIQQVCKNVYEAVKHLWMIGMTGLMARPASSDVNAHRKRISSFCLSVRRLRIRMGVQAPTTTVTVLPMNSMLCQSYV